MSAALKKSAQHAARHDAGTRAAGVLIEALEHGQGLSPEAAATARAALREFYSVEAPLAYYATLECFAAALANYIDKRARPLTKRPRRPSLRVIQGAQS